MATYGYRCDVDGPVDVKLPIGTAPATIACPNCGEPAARVFTAPMLGLADRRRLAAIEHGEKSRDEPDVVSAPAGAPRRQTRMAPPNPAFARLPRPLT
ncbi:MAG: hypothetical protein QOG20_482 [Pseudonocardiales bacterium]|jgi:hypothetical protein|uniref:zinc ribbon domain-containing protein n=1 Tax=Pseudonocardia sp. TaxID=60912 RepID=UPI00263286ED|nr:zinc ribbon domain-containing protein [Pseudonocardia sp.]MCW2716282.1 hypothetical protein [Pseudonocardia sp.]MDT7613840.1 hypothetical protein [Pseudonocardiales bacterium]MDT7704875.1 hypothetical protein [Pseudonocardiales bacterium]